MLEIKDFMLAGAKNFLLPLGIHVEKYFTHFGLGVCGIGVLHGASS